MTVEEARAHVDEQEPDFYAALLFDALLLMERRRMSKFRVGEVVTPFDVAEVVLEAYRINNSDGEDDRSFHHPQPAHREPAMSRTFQDATGRDPATELDSLRRAVAESVGADPDTWPTHGNAPLAISATVASQRLDAERLMVALQESVKLQSHYAKLLNMYDGGERRQFSSAEEWIERLVEVRP